jgi:hypothetical protein
MAWSSTFWSSRCGGCGVDGGANKAPVCGRAAQAKVGRTGTKEAGEPSPVPGVKTIGGVAGGSGTWANAGATEANAVSATIRIFKLTNLTHLATLSLTTAIEFCSICCNCEIKCYCCSHLSKCSPDWHKRGWSSDGRLCSLLNEWSQRRGSWGSWRTRV